MGPSLGQGPLPPQAATNGMGLPPPLPPQAATNGMGASPDGMGASPDGVGSYMANPGGQVINQTPSTHYYPAGPVGAEIQFLEPEDTSGKAALQSAGFTALVVALTTGIGFAWGKAWGAVAGLTFGGAIMNGYRAQKWMNDPEPAKRHEAVVSATVGVGEIVVGAYAIWKAAQAGKS